MDCYLKIFQVIVFLLQQDNPDLSETLGYIFLLHPAYAWGSMTNWYCVSLLCRLGIGLANMYTNQGIKNACEESEAPKGIAITPQIAVMAHATNFTV